MKFKNFSWLASAAIILLLVIAGPAHGFSLSLLLDNTSPFRGELITFTASMNLKQSEPLPIEYLTIIIDGPETQICKFSPAGKIIEGCKGIVSIKKTDSTNYGYGYYNHGYFFGYGYGYSLQASKLVYKIALDTSNYMRGSYSTKIKVKIDSKEFSESGPGFSIIKQGGGRSRPPQECETNWTCTPFGSCINGYQYRSCALENPECALFPETPALSQTCTMLPLSAPTETSLPEPPLEQQASEENSQKKITRITGAVIGPFNATLADLFIVILGFVVVIGGISTLLIIRRISLKKKHAYYTGILITN